MQRYSKKREDILECLRSTTEHPSAEWVYEKLKLRYPRLSLATVYRNLSQMKNEGIIRSVGIVNGHERFDAFSPAHTHVICRKCGKVADAFDIRLPKELSDMAGVATGFEIEQNDLRFFGVCAECKLKENSKKR